jgi:hypothetical protein
MRRQLQRSTQPGNTRADNKKIKLCIWAHLSGYQVRGKRVSFPFADQPNIPQHKSVFRK